MTSPMSQVLADAVSEAKTRGVYEEGDEALLGLETNCYLNMVGGQRPSDAARSVARWYLTDPAKFREDFAAARSHR